ncbi:MAG: c-type cytochrome [Cocleimonas sp.]
MSKILNTSLLAIVLTASSSIAFADNKTGKKTYEQVCSACHASGAAGSPEFGDSTAWARRIAKGKAALYTSAINGKGAMPAKGGQTSLSDEVIKATVDYMVSNSSKI